MKNITLSADEKLIEAARARAHAERTTVNEQFRKWLATYAREKGRLQHYDAVIADVRGKVHVGHKVSRDEMNER